MLDVFSESDIQDVKIQQNRITSIRLISEECIHAKQKGKLRHIFNISSSPFKMQARPKDPEKVALRIVYGFYEEEINIGKKNPTNYLVRQPRMVNKSPSLILRGSTTNLLQIRSFGIE